MRWGRFLRGDAGTAVRLGDLNQSGPGLGLVWACQPSRAIWIDMVVVKGLGLRASRVEFWCR